MHCQTVINSPVNRRQPATMLKGMYNLWKTQDLCDVIIVTKNGIIKCHKVALAAQSALLARMISEYAPDDIVRIRLPDHNLNAVHTVLNFVYTSNGELKSDNISQVISLIIKLGFNNLKDTCNNYLIECCTCDNAIFHYSIALNNKLFETAQILFNIITDNFSTVSNTTQFLYLSCERLLPIVKCGHLNVNGEMDIFMALVNWINFDKVNRIPNAKKLLSDVHFEDIHADDLLTETERSRWLLSESSPVRDVILEVIREQCFRAKNNCCINYMANGATTWNVSDSAPVSQNYRYGCSPTSPPIYNGPPYPSGYNGYKKNYMNLFNRFSDSKMCLSKTMPIDFQAMGSRQTIRSDISALRHSSFDSLNVSFGPKSFLNRQYNQFKEINGKRVKKRSRAKVNRSQTTVSASENRHRGKERISKRRRKKVRKRRGLPYSKSSQSQGSYTPESFTRTTPSSKSLTSNKSGILTKNLVIPVPHRRGSKRKRVPSRRSARSDRSLVSRSLVSSDSEKPHSRTKRSPRSVSSSRSRGSTTSTTNLKHPPRCVHKSCKVTEHGSKHPRFNRRSSYKHFRTPTTSKKNPNKCKSSRRHQQAHEDSKHLHQFATKPSKKKTKSSLPSDKTIAKDRLQCACPHYHHHQHHHCCYCTNSRQSNIHRSPVRTRSVASNSTAKHSTNSGKFPIKSHPSKNRSDTLHPTSREVLPVKKPSSSKVIPRKNTLNPSKESVGNANQRHLSTEKAAGRKLSKRRHSDRSLSGRSKSQNSSKPKLHHFSGKNISTNSHFPTFKNNMTYINPGNYKKSDVNIRYGSSLSRPSVANDLNESDNNCYSDHAKQQRKDIRKDPNERHQLRTKNVCISVMSGVNRSGDVTKIDHGLRWHQSQRYVCDVFENSSLSFVSPIDDPDYTDEFDTNYIGRMSKQTVTCNKLRDSNYSLNPIQENGIVKNPADDSMHYNMVAQDAPYLLVIGGLDSSKITRDVPGKAVIALSLNPRRNGSSWIRVALQLEQYLHHHQSAIVHGTLYLIGGTIFNPDVPEILGTATDGVTIFNFRTGEWRLGLPMLFPRAYFNMVRWRDNLIVVGGTNGEGFEAEQIDVYDTAEDKWNILTHHPGGPRLGVAAAVMNNRLFTVGGYTESMKHKGETLDDAYCYDILLDQWTLLNYLPYPISHASLEVINSRLILMGGRTVTKGQKTSSSDSILTYLEKQNQWKEIGKLTSGRHDMASTAVRTDRNKTYIYLVGGTSNSSSTALKIVECVTFDEETGKAVIFITNSTPFAVTGTACCIVK